MAINGISGGNSIMQSNYGGDASVSGKIQQLTAKIAEKSKELKKIKEKGKLTEQEQQQVKQLEQQIMQLQQRLEELKKREEQQENNQKDDLSSSYEQEGTDAINSEQITETGIGENVDTYL